MQKILESSYIYRFFAAIYAWFGRQWKRSRLIGRFLSPSRAREMSESSVFTRLWDGFHRGLCFMFEKLRFTRLFDGSIFAMPYLWCALSVALAPALPTSAVIVLVAVSFVSFLINLGCSREKKLVFSPINRYVILYAFVYLFAIFTSVTVSGSLYGGLLTVFFVLFTVVFENSVTTRRGLDWIIYAAVAAGTLVAAYGVYQYVFGTKGAAAWIDSDMFSKISTRVYSTLDNPNVLSEYLLLVIPFAFACVLAVKNILPKLFFICCTCGMILCMVLTFSRGGWLGLIFAAAIFLVMLDRRYILLGIAALIALYFFLPQTIVSRFTSIGNAADTSTSYRLAIWMGSIAMLKDYWMCGIGPGTAAFNKVYPLYSYNSAAAQHSHNLFLQITCDTGICGIVIFLVIICLYLKTLCSAVSQEKDRTSKVYQIAGVSSVVGFLVQSATDFSFYNYRVMLCFWAILGLGAVVARRSRLPEVRSDG